MLARRSSARVGEHSIGRSAESKWSTAGCIEEKCDEIVERREEKSKRTRKINGQTEEEKIRRGT
jgi:hypothetical protein